MGSVSVLAAAAGDDETELSNMLSEMSGFEPGVTKAHMDAGLARQESDKEGFRFMLGFFMMLSFLMSMSIMQMLHADRLDGTFRRIRASNVTPTEYVLSIACIGFVISLLIVGPSLLIWRMTGSYAGVPLDVTVLMLFAFSVLVISFSVLIGIIIPSFNGIIAVSTTAATITSMLGGAWFPLEMAPPVFRAISKFTPQYWVYEAIYSFGDGNANVADAGLGALVVPLAVLLLTSLIFLLLSGVRFAGNKGNARALAR
jgi:ABC-2 type transport system permease protein